MSDTPVTDAAICRYPATYLNPSEEARFNGELVVPAKIARKLEHENARLRDGLPFRRFEHVLRKHGLIDPQAMDDPEGFDNYRTHGAIHAAHRELTAEA